MTTDDFDAFAPFFSQPDAVELTQADNDTLDNWVRYKHVLPQRVGKRRMFSFIDLLRVDLMHMLTKMFRTEVGVAAFIAADAAKGYLDLLEQDRTEIQAGTPWPQVSHDRDAHISLNRDPATGELRAQKRGELSADDVMVVLPVRLLARRLLAAVELWSQRA